jgi:transposase
MSYIIEQKIKGKIYLYRVESYWDKEKKQARQKRTYIGRKDKPQASQIKALLSNLTTKNYGNIRLFESIVEATGLGRVLQSCFASDYKEILALSYYEIMEASPGYLFHYWLQEQDLNDVKQLHSSDISKLHESIGLNQKGRMSFTHKWIEALKPIHGIYYDITSFSSYSTKNDFVEWGYNRDKESLPQINLGMVCCRDSGLPFFYNTFSGSIVDVSTLKNLLKYLEEYKLEDFILIMDRGFFSTSNILSLMKSPIQIRFLQPLSFSLKKAKELIRQNAEALKNTDTAFKYNEEIMHHLTAPIFIKNQSFTAHIFYNEKVELDQRHRFLSELLDAEALYKGHEFACKADAQSFIDLEIPEKLNDFFHWDESKKSLLKNDVKIKEHTAKLGYFIIMTNEENIDKQTVLHYYRDKDKVEKIFNAVKNEMDGDRLRSHSRYNTDGRLFIKFIALIIYMQITKVMREKKLFEKYSIQELLRELAKIKITCLQNIDPVKSEISKKQTAILNAFGLNLSNT